MPMFVIVFLFVFGVVDAAAAEVLGFVVDSNVGGGGVVIAFWLWLWLWLLVSVLPLVVNEAVTSHALLHQQKKQHLLLRFWCDHCDNDALFQNLLQMLI